MFAPVSLSSIPEIVRASSSIPGWISGEDAVAVAEASLTLPIPATIVEVGVLLGRSTILLAGSCRLRGVGKVHCVDPFDGSGDDFSVPYYHDILGQSGKKSFESAFRENMANHGLSDWVEVHRGTASSIARTWQQPVDLLFLDADHSPEGARLAYEAWLPALNRGGVIVLRNTRQGIYAKNHDGHRRLVVEEIHPPRFTRIRQVGATTLAVKDF